jgi:hypothetical protein
MSWSGASVAAKKYPTPGYGVGQGGLMLAQLIRKDIERKSEVTHGAPSGSGKLNVMRNVLPSLAKLFAHNPPLWPRGHFRCSCATEHAD